MREEFNPADAVQAFVRRASTSATPEPASGKKEKLAVNWDSVNQTVFDAANEKKVVNMSSNEIMTAVLNKGVKELDAMIEKGVDFGALRNSNGMSLLHAAAASSSPNALEIIMEIVRQMLIDVNDRSNVGMLSWREP